MNSREPAVVVERAYELAIWLLPHTENFPRSHRFTIGDRMIETCLDLLLRLVDAAYTKRKEEPHRQAVAAVNRLRYFVRLAKDMRALPAKG